MTEPLKKKVSGTVGELAREHPTLQKRLDDYRDRRSAYEAKRVTTAAPSPPPLAPVEPSSRRHLRG